MSVTLYFLSVCVCVCNCKLSEVMGFKCPGQLCFTMHSRVEELL